jgi:hypothetical protein
MDLDTGYWTGLDWTGYWILDWILDLDMDTGQSGMVIGHWMKPDNWILSIHYWKFHSTNI